MKRREFIGVLGVAVVAWPLAARVQQPDRISVGYVSYWHCTSFAAVQQNPTLSQALRTCRRPGGGSGTRAYDPKRASGRDGGCMSAFMQPAKHGIVTLQWVETDGADQWLSLSHDENS